MDNGLEALQDESLGSMSSEENSDGRNSISIQRLESNGNLKPATNAHGRLLSIVVPSKNHEL